MTTVDTEAIRNVALLGQGGVGKTTVAEGMLFLAGAIDRPGKVDDGTSHGDTEPEEIQHRVSVTAALHSFSRGSRQITLLDTPGYANFLGDTRCAVSAVDGAVLVLPPGGPLKVETEMVWNWAVEAGTGIVGFVSNLDREGFDRETLFATLSERTGARPVALSLPLGSGAEFRGTVDLLRWKAVLPAGEGAEVRLEEVPEDVAGEAGTLREQLVEAIAEANDELLEKYLEEGELSEEELLSGLRTAVVSRQILPVLCGSGLRRIGLPALLDAVAELLPSPAEAKPKVGTDPKTGEPVERNADANAPFSARVFKTIVDPFAGKLSVLRIESGTLTPDATVWNPGKDARERLHGLVRIQGKKQESLTAAGPGEIVATAKLKETLTGDTLCDEKTPTLYEPVASPPASISFAIEPKSRGDEEKAAHGLQRLLEEDVALDMHRDRQTREIILSGQGQQHIEIVVERLRRKYGVDVDLKAPKVPYRETIRGKANAQGKYKKQSGGRGQYGDAWIEVEPLPRGKGYEFVDKIVGGVIPRPFIPAVDKGIREAMEQGFLAGYPLQDIRVTLYDGSHHSVDSSEMAFKIAGSMAFRAAIEKAKPVLLEPVMKMVVTVPDDVVGDVIGDLNSRRGKVAGVDAQGGEELIQAIVPMAEVLRYAPDLKSLTGGRGRFTMELDHYEEVPPHVTQKIIEATGNARQGAKASG